jgi:hypothetical protein
MLQYVTVTGVDDEIEDGNVTFQIIMNKAITFNHSKNTKYFETVHLQGPLPTKETMPVTRQ